MPLRIALALTLMRMTRPLTTARTFWMFALNLRAVMPVTLVPTPPRYLALPRCVIWLPKLVFLPVKWQTRGMVQVSPEKQGREVYGKGDGNSSSSGFHREVAKVRSLNLSSRLRDFAV